MPSADLYVQVSLHAPLPIACPQCSYHPSTEDRWMCAPDGCGTLWDTFATAARCPGCNAQFLWTVCPVCGRTSPHQAWYLARSNEELKPPATPSSLVE